MQNFITKYFLLLCFAFFGPALLVCVLPFASFIQFNASPANKADGDRTDYYISHGFDFANGDNLIEKRWKNGTVEWVHRNKSEYTKTYEKYGLGRNVPLVRFCATEGFIANYFIKYQREYPQSRRLDWKPWRWKWYFFKDIPTICGDGDIPLRHFLYVAERNNLPVEKVRSVYDGCLERLDNFYGKDGMSDYVNRQIDEVEFNKLKPQMMHLITTGDERWLHDLGYDRVERLLKNYREQFPQDLPDVFLELISRIGICTIIDHEYQRNPQRRIAIYLALSHTVNRQKNKFCYLYLFENLNKLDKLDLFIKQIYPESVTFPPLPTPQEKKKDKDGRVISWLGNIYYTDSYEGLPERQKLLNISANIEACRQYWLAELKKQDAK